MSVIRYRPRAQRDLLRIYQHVARENPVAAAKVFHSLRDKVSHLGEYPMGTAARPDLGESTRLCPAGAYHILYRPLSGGVEIVRIVHGARDLRGLLK